MHKTGRFVKDLRGVQTEAIQDPKSLLKQLTAYAGAIDNAKTAKADIPNKIDAVLNTDIQ